LREREQELLFPFPEKRAARGGAEIEAARGGHDFQSKYSINYSTQAVQYGAFIAAVLSFIARKSRQQVGTDFEAFSEGGISVQSVHRPYSRQQTVWARFLRRVQSVQSVQYGWVAQISRQKF
jgi:hypothetical protein